MVGLQITDVNATNVDRVGFFCAMSKPDTEGYQRKLRWIKQRFPEGLKLKLITQGGRGFIEYIPGRFAWRGILADEYMVIHCIWVVGRAKRSNCGTALLAECLRDAKDNGMAGVAVVTARDQLGLPPTDFFLKRGFECVDNAPPGLELLARKFRRAANPRFLSGWREKILELGSGLSVVCSPQCPYSDSYIANVAALAKNVRFHLM